MQVELFQREYEKCLNVVANQCSQNGYLSEYKVNTFGQSLEYTVTFDSSDNTVNCSCMKLEYMGFLCSYALRVLDHGNIKVVLSRYFLRRWTKDARIGCAEEDSDFIIQEDSKLVAARRYRDICCSILDISARAAESDYAFQVASRQLNEVIEGVEKILTLKAEEAQDIASSRSAANASDSENAEIFLDGNAIGDKDESSRAASKEGIETVVPDRHSKTKRIQNERSNSPNSNTCISSPSAACVSPQTFGPAPVVQGLFNFEANQVVQCIYQQPNLVMDQQPNAEMYQQPNFYNDQHDSPSQTQLLQEPSIHSSYHDSVSNSTQMTQLQAMELDIQPPHSASFLLYDHRYRTSDTPFFEPK